MEKLMTLSQLAEYLQLGKSTVYKMVQKGEIPGIKIANQWRFKKSEIDKWLQAQQGKRKVSGNQEVKE
ncbi:helix-turn-helix domain-containing protein [Candidatus Aerophobetes bacterium]|nr:helix-turn-helix domain-containing protein [Candidatus Aerophobetes bacterium]